MAIANPMYLPSALIQMQPVSSSNVQAVGYDSKNFVLQVQFKNGTTYQYFNVPRSVYDNLIQAPSVGKYLFQNIKNYYNYQQV